MGFLKVCVLIAIDESFWELGMVKNAYNLNTWEVEA